MKEDTTRLVYIAALFTLYLLVHGSPRGAGIEGETESWDFGAGAGFYLNATEPKWSNHYRMYDYVTKVRAGGHRNGHGQLE